MNHSSSYIVACDHCGTKNRISSDKIGATAKCGKCGTPLREDQNKPDLKESYIFRCTQCGTRNKIPAAKLESGAKCGKCGSALKTDELFIPQPFIVSDSNFDSGVLKSPLPVLLFAWAPW
jgi:thioredoxin 2